MWKTIPGFDEHYLVNEQGEVWSEYKQRLLSVSYSKEDGYGRIGLGDNVYLIHRLVAMAFLGNDTEKQVNHKDGNKQNNTDKNLEWVTQSENALHRQTLLNNSCNIDENEVIELHNSGYSYKQIADMLSVSKGTVSNIIKKEREDSKKRIDFAVLKNESVALIPGYDCYYASNMGRILSKKSGKEIIPHPNSNGYLRINLRKDGKRRCYYVHRLVMSAFCGESDMVVNHINRNKTDNRLCNLEYITQSENVKHSSRRKLTEDDYKEIIRLKQNGHKREEIAEMFEITKCYVNTICRTKNRLE